MRLRLLVVARLIGAWAAALALLLLFFGCWDLIDFYKHNRGVGMSLWLIKLLAMVSVPLVGSASVICFALPQSITSHPFLWTFAAVVTTSITAFSVANRAGLVFSLMVSVPSAVLFLVSMRLWPLTKGTNG
jgi:hypothetical protein